MSAKTTLVHTSYFLTLRAPRYPPDITGYLQENTILGQMSHELSCKQFLSMKMVVDMYVVCGMGSGTQVVDKVMLDLIV